MIHRARKELHSARTASRILIGILIAVLLVIGVALVQTVAADRRAREHVELTSKALSLLRRSLLAGIDAETGERGFVLTGDPAFLEPYERGSTTWLPTLARLRAVLQEEPSPHQEAALTRLEQLAAARLAGLEQTISLSKSGARQEAARIVATGPGKRIMDDYRATATALESEHTALQRQGIDKARAVEARALPIIFLLGVSVLGLVLVGLSLERRAARAEAAVGDAVRLREAHARSDLLARELNHRVKNLFSVILSIVTLSAREEANVKRLVASIRSRVYALSLAHAVSQGQSDTDKVRLGDLVSSILKPYQDEKGRVRLGGGDLQLPVRAVTPLGLVIHELATNAAKYGSLSVEDGTVEVCWTTREGKEGLEVQLLWNESHGPAVAHQGEAGFGSMLLEKAALQLGGRLKRDWLRDGVGAELVFPLEVE